MQILTIPRASQIHKQLDLRYSLSVICDDEEYKEYVTELQAIVNNGDHWKHLRFLKPFIDFIESQIELLETNTSISIAYYSWLMVFKYVDDKIEELHKQCNDDTDFTDYNVTVAALLQDEDKIIINFGCILQIN